MQQQDWKKAWDCLNPDEEAKQRMQQAILQKLQETANAPEKSVPKQKQFWNGFSQSVFVRAAALCCAAVTMAVAGLHLFQNGQQQEKWVSPDTVTPSQTVSTTETTPVSTTTPVENAVIATGTQTVAQTGITTQTMTETASATESVTASAVETTPVEWDIEEETVETEPATSSVADPVQTAVPVATTTGAETAVTVLTTEPPALTETVTETTETLRAVAIYGSLYDYQYTRWNGVRYQTDYQTIPYEALGDLAGFSVARREDSDQLYTISVYPLKDVPIEECIAVQYAGDTEYFYFYAIS